MVTNNISTAEAPDIHIYWE